jgi:hypothetical protein
MAVSTSDLDCLLQSRFIGPHGTGGRCDFPQIADVLKLGRIERVRPCLKPGGGFVDLLVGVLGHDGHRPLLKELWSGWDGVDDDWVLAFQIEDPDLEQRAVGRGTDQHCELVIDVLADRVPHGVLDVMVR